MPYRIIALEKMNIIETNEWKKGDQYITISTTWRTGSAEIEEQPDLSTYDPEVGITISEEFESPGGLKFEAQHSPSEFHYRTLPLAF